MIKMRCQINYKNPNGRFGFDGGAYRLKNARKEVISPSKSSVVLDKYGRTEYINVRDNEKIYIEMKNIAENKWQSIFIDGVAFVTSNKNKPIINVIVENHYFKMKLVDSNGKALNWGYIITFKDSKKRSFSVHGKCKNGESKYISSSILTGKNKEIFDDMSKNKTHDVHIKAIPPKTKLVHPEFNLRLIPIGSDKAYRLHKIAVASGNTEELEKESITKLKDLREYRKVLLDINIQKGASYTIEREDKGVLYDHDIAETRKVTFQDNTLRNVYIPKKYNGNLLLKKSGKLISKFPLGSLDPNKNNKSLVFCLNNKSNSVTRQKISSDSIVNTEVMMWHFATKEEINEGFYEFDRESKGNTNDLVKIANTIFSSIMFDGVVLPTLGEAQNALKENNRGFIYDSLKKLKVGKEKKEVLKFYIKKSKTGSNMIIFKGYSGLRSFLKGTRYGINNMKVGMIASASSVYIAASTAGVGAAVKTTASTAGKSLGGIGFGIVAYFEIAEWLTTDDPFNNWSDLWIGLGSSAIKGVVATAAGVVMGGLAIATMTAAAPAIAIVAIGAVTVIAVSFSLEFVDRKFAITDKAKKYIDEAGY